MARFKLRCAQAVALLVLVAMAPAGYALTPPMACTFAPELGRFVGPDETAPPKSQSVLPDTFANGLVYFEVADIFGQGDRSRWLVVQHCRSSKGLMVRITPGQPSVRARFDQMVFGKQPYTMSEIAKEMSALGAKARLGPVKLGSCPCDHQKFFYGD